MVFIKVDLPQLGLPMSAMNAQRCPGEMSFESGSLFIVFVSFLSRVGFFPVFYFSLGPVSLKIYPE
jgi:hypothetical protein